jgi:hypothetical protein
MNWSYDDRGNAINLQITLKEIKQRRWHLHPGRIPPIWREAVRQVLAQEAADQDRAELAARVQPGSPQGGWLRRLRAERSSVPSGAAAGPARAD